MKELNFERMEEVNGGMSYCGLLAYWCFGGGLSNYQGDVFWLYHTFFTNC